MYNKLQFQTSSNTSVRKVLLKNVSPKNVQKVLRGKSVKIVDVSDLGVVVSSIVPISYSYIALPKDFLDSLLKNDLYEGVCKKVEPFELKHIYERALVKQNSTTEKCETCEKLVEFVSSYNKGKNKGTIASEVSVFLSLEDTLYHEGNALNSLISRLGDIETNLSIECI